MDHRRRPCGSRLNGTWNRLYCIAAAIVFATAGGVGLAVFPDAFGGCWLRGRHHHVANTLLPDEDAGVVDAVADSSHGTGVSRTKRGMPEQVWGETSGNDTSGDGLTKHYSSFTEYVVERSTRKNLSSLPVPVVEPVGQESALSIPVISIIGVQKGGTTNLRENLLTHPRVWGVRNEVHFFDKSLLGYPDVGLWEGDGLDADIGIEATGEILSEYAQACVVKGEAYSQRHSGTYRTDGLLVDASPRYIFNPLAPYRIKMVRPGAKFVIVLRDPTDRYFSQLQMELCRTKHNEDSAVSPPYPISTFHPPGGAKEYLTRADKAYEPYTAVCRGENASSSDLGGCYRTLDGSNPLYRGLYADQLERWFRVFDRSQILVIESSELFADFTAVVASVANFAGLPEHNFEYDSSHEFKEGGCDDEEKRKGNDYFASGGRYDTMLEEAEVLREWYRPHNDRLYKLLGRERMWR